MNSNPIAAKPHYAVLDGLRGVAALLVVAFHLCEAHAHSRFEQIINHGYLAVDFFFLLSGFVIGYAYDDRWGKLSMGNFFKRRLIRLQPMVIIGMVVGAVCFYFQSGSLWPMINTVPAWKVILIMLVGFTMLPVPPSMDIRGWIEMYPLNGPGWSLFFEYIANILYAVVFRRFSKVALAVFVFLAACLLVHLAVFGKQGDVIGGWALEPEQMHIGFSRVLFPFFAGLLLCRSVKIMQVKNAFFICSMLVALVLSLPRFGGESKLWLNGLYDSFSIIIMFPLIVWLGAGGGAQGKLASKVCKFFGDISYPIYITHYPIIYIYTAWVHENKMPLASALPYTILSFVACVAVAYTSFKLYDEPVRKWLATKF